MNVKFNNDYIILPNHRFVYEHNVIEKQSLFLHIN